MFIECKVESPGTGLSVHNLKINVKQKHLIWWEI